MVRIALASPRPSTSLEDALGRIDRLTAEASKLGAVIICFPEAYVPGLRGQDFEIWPYDANAYALAMEAIAGLARRHRIGTVMGIEVPGPGGRRIAAAV